MTMHLATRELEARSDTFPEAPQVPPPPSCERWIPLAVFAVSLAYLSVFRRHVSMEPDEGIVLEGAQRILRGEVPYRDFFSFYTPGSYYLQAACFRLFGNSLPAARMILALCGAICSAVTYLLSRRVCTVGIALAVSLLVTWTTLPFRFLILHNWYSTLWACLAIYCAVRLIESSGWVWSFFLGTLAAITVLFEQSKGAGLCLGVALGFAAVWWTGRSRRLFSGREWAALGLGLVWPVALTLGYFASQRALSVMLADWLWPLRHYSQANRVVYGYQNWSDETRHELLSTGSVTVRAIKLLAISPCLWIPVLPLIGVGVLMYCVWRGDKAMLEPQRNYYLMVAGASTGLLLSVVLVRADIIHFMYLQPVFAVVLAWGLDGVAIPGAFFHRIKALLNGCVVTALILLGIVPLAGLAASNHLLATRRGLLAMPGRDTVIDYLQQHVSPYERTLIYPYLPLYYYLTDTSSPGRYDYFQPGMNTHEQAAEMIAKLKTSSVRTVLYEITFPEKIPHSWPGTPISAIANDPVGDYILHNYHRCEVLKSPTAATFLFLVRNDSACP